jgi:hypothetical protein
MNEIIKNVRENRIRKNTRLPFALFFAIFNPIKDEDSKK